MMYIESQPWRSPLLYGLGFWLVFLLVLEPGNVLRAWEMGYSLPPVREALRIAAATLLGACATPPLLMVAANLPLAGARRVRHALLQLAAHCGIALALIVASCFLAAWGFHSRLLPSMAELQGELAVNYPLLVFAVCACSGIAHMARLLRSVREPPAPPVPGTMGSPETGFPTTGSRTTATRIEVKTGARLRFVELKDLDWIETQGNYLALHADGRAHLIRRTLADFEAELDPLRFVRIHRRMIVAVDRIEELKPLANGDAQLILRDGRELRVSRRYRDGVRQRWAGIPPN